MIDPKYPRVVGTPDSLAPGEMRLIRKVAGVELDALDPIDAARGTAFVELFRQFPDDDIEALWEAAEWVRVKPTPDGAPSPLGAANSPI
jgi:hypothetical protein